MAPHRTAHWDLSYVNDLLLEFANEEVGFVEIYADDTVSSIKPKYCLDSTINAVLSKWYNFNKLTRKRII